MNKKDSLIVAKERNPIPFRVIEGASVLVVSGSSEFTVELAYALKSRRPAMNYCWSMESFISLPLIRADVVIIGSDAWGAYRVYGKKVKEKLATVKKAYVLTAAQEDAQQFLADLRNVTVLSCYDQLEQQVISSLTHNG